MTIELHEGDNRDSLRRLIDNGVKVHSVVCDPPYGLVSVTKRFGKEGAAPALSNGPTGVFGRAAGGFMGRAWDSTFIERDPEFWKLVWEVLLPGGYCVAFSGARTGHWQACAMEQAGFIMHPMLGWIFGQGFPKAHNAAKAIDRELGADPEVVDTVKRRDIRNGQGETYGSNITAAALRQGGPKYIDHAITRPGSPEAQKWDGWAYGAQSLKPALEPIYVGQKPFSEKNGALNLLKHGVGALNIDGCRVPVDARVDDPRLGGKGSWSTDKAASNVYEGGYAGNDVASSSLGRHPANLLHDGSDAARSCFPDSKGQQGDVRGTEPSSPTKDIYGQFGGRVPATKREDSDTSAARFFNALGDDMIPVFYHPKATKADRAGSKHPTVKPIALMRWLCRLVTPPGGTVLDPFAGSGSTGAAAQAEGFSAILMEMESDYTADIRNRFGLTSRTPHLPDDIADFLGLPRSAISKMPTSPFFSDIDDLL